MSAMKWWVAADDLGGVFVAPIEPKHVSEFDTIFDDELEAHEHALNCVMARRDGVSSSIATLRKRRRALLKKAAQ